MQYRVREPWAAAHVAGLGLDGDTGWESALSGATCATCICTAGGGGFFVYWEVICIHLPPAPMIKSIVGAEMAVAQVAGGGQKAAANAASMGSRILDLMAATAAGESKEEGFVI